MNSLYLMHKLCHHYYSFFIKDLDLKIILLLKISLNCYVYLNMITQTCILSLNKLIKTS